MTVRMDISPAEIQIMNAKNAALQRKVNALSYLPQVIAEKEYEARESRMKADQLEAALTRLHKHFQDVVKWRNATDHPFPKYAFNGDINGDWSDSGVQTSLPILTDLPSGKGQEFQARGVNLVSRNVSCPVFPGGLETDGEALVAPMKAAHIRPVFPVSIGAKQNSEQSSESSLLPADLSSQSSTKSASSTTSETRHSQKVHTGQSTDTFFPATDLSTKSSTSPNSSMKTTSPTEVKPPVQLRGEIFLSSEVSKPHFDKLISENARMKDALRRIGEKKNIDVNQFMSAMEYERVIYLLREELFQVKYHMEELQHILILQSSSSPTSKKLLELQRKNAELSQDILSKNDLITSYKESYDKLKQQLEETQRKLDSNEPVIPQASTDEVVDALALQQTIAHQDLKLQELFSEVDRLNKVNKNLSEEVLSHNSRPPLIAPESLRQLTEENKKLHQESGVLRRNLKSLKEDNDVMTLQLNQFNSDFEKIEEKNRKMLEERNLKIRDLERRQLSVRTDRDTRHYLEAEVQKLREQVQTLQQTKPIRQSGHRSDDSGFGSYGSTEGSLSSQKSHSSRRGLQSIDEGIHSKSFDPSYQSDLSSRYASSGYGSTTRSGGFGSGSHGSFGSHTSGPSSSSSSSSAPLVCDRCEAEFKRFEYDKYQEHRKKCEI